MSIDQKLINEIVNRVLAVVQAERVILFGSAASGEMTRNSDIDLLVLESTPGNTREKSVRLNRALRPFCPQPITRNPRPAYISYK